MFRTIIVAAALLLALPAGCSSRSQITSDDPLGAAPSDLTLAVTTLVGPEALPYDQAHRRFGRYVLFPDGSLHYGVDADAGVDSLPPRTRVLSRRQVAEVWSALTQLGLADRSAGTAPVFAGSIEPPPDGLAHLLVITAHDERWMFQDRVTGDVHTDTAAATIVRMLAALAWASDAANRDVVVVPRRYDLGPDPYARYRRP